jgi:hypothetical protein
MAFLFRSTDNVAEYNQPDDDALCARKKPDAALMMKQEEKRSWDAAHQQTCESLNSIIATPRQVLEITIEGPGPNNNNTVEERPDVTKYVSWKNEMQAVELVSKRLLEFQQEEASMKQLHQSASTRRSASWMTPVTWLFQILTTTMTNDDVDDWKQEDDEHDAVARTLVDWDEPIVNVTRAAESCQAILRHLGDMPRVFHRKGEDEETCFYGWCHTFSSLPTEQLAFLTKVLIATDYATVKDDCIVLHTDPHGDDVETAVASFQIQQAIQSMETKVDAWVVQIQHCQQTALLMNRAHKPKSQILSELKKKKLLEKHVESARMALLNLEQTQSSLDTVTNQVEIVKLLQVSRDTFRNIKGEITTEQVDEMVSDLQEEMELVTESNAVFLAETTGGSRLNEEDALLEELQNLTLDEGSSKNETTKTSQSMQHLEETSDTVEGLSIKGTHERPSQSTNYAKTCTAKTPVLAS